MTMDLHKACLQIGLFVELREQWAEEDRKITMRCEGKSADALEAMCSEYHSEIMRLIAEKRTLLAKLRAEGKVAQRAAAAGGVTPKE